MIWMYNHEWTSHKSLRSLLTHLAVGTATCWWPIHEAALCCWVESSTAQSNATQVSSKLPKWLHHLWLPHLKARTVLFFEIKSYTSHGSPSQALPWHRFYNGIFTIVMLGQLCTLSDRASDNGVSNERAWLAKEQVAWYTFLLWSALLWRLLVKT